MMIPQVPILVHFFVGKKKSVTDYLIIHLTTHTHNIIVIRVAIITITIY